MTAFISAHGLGRSCLFPTFEVGPAPLQFPICPSSALCPLPIPNPGLGPVFLLRVLPWVPVPPPRHYLAQRRHSCTVSRMRRVQGVWEAEGQGGVRVGLGVWGTTVCDDGMKGRSSVPTALP